MLTLLYYQDGLAAEWVKIFRQFKRTKKWGRSYHIDLADVSVPANERAKEFNVNPQTLHVTSLRVQYGAVVAVDDVSFKLEPGTVTGLIGPNGAGKTSLIDAVSDLLHQLVRSCWMFKIFRGLTLLVARGLDCRAHSRGSNFLMMPPFMRISALQPTHKIAGRTFETWSDQRIHCSQGPLCAQLPNSISSTICIVT